MLMHQGIGLAAYNDMPIRRAVHAVYECCCSVSLAADLARDRPYENHDALFRKADELLFGLSEDSIDSILQAYPDVGRRAGSTKSAAEQCAVFDERPEVMEQLSAASRRYREHFGFGFVMYVNGYCAQDVLAALTDRLLNDYETERKVVRNELARINRIRLERMLGPEGGYHNW
ncbi:2-oxo-4-hydroxy-4-carboxy-5-ureidoimidazoline decarboxylase [Mycolicibacterium monacense]|uniref:2-oxo-4-hydroxy-4-carboxy-5-ureidoimidazoline decarboxylase n=2 Tax=Mycobacteriaceae TaxID=1762 RepID=A0AAD1N2C1_MYCMB|nr:2-oxo-4-hydroxy-4-carboxy-5-ureidoimidazoline decarboxylase [Mycolicibacterium monacense]MDA4105291.1 OHCU decarboxylase [Mycolicibacterium monacense DSM 44395]ORB21730.1 2-oxo-4-hydroxy-4-carboxy-5-ureidoimidazoline decarboxylase [Mycolicibacterium monacense DSM 44395]QHP88502.1 2-oxo-4-hydroxy-4-carboxy-5-ureidoimidazoline decarboxylase [Mycolicibacterium monacense DSM 44395]BBZ64087.1 2-oxo-4-hydroxy-4-carboxy-5-ureidoimidazoline decarboxylase [Mycolicibacterium monacense]